MIPTFRGVLLLLLPVPLIALGAVQAELEWLGWGAVCLAAFALGLDVYLADRAARLEVTRTHEPRLSLAAQNLIGLEIEQRGPFPLKFWVRDEPPEAFEVDIRILQGEVQPRTRWKGGYHVRPAARGDYKFGAINLRWLSPLGLVLRQKRIPAEEAVKVFPNLLEVSRYEVLLHRNRLQEMGLRTSRTFGEGTEFERLREYSPDDAFRRINWKASARRMRPVTATYQTERSQNIMLALDIGRMMHSPVEKIAKLDYMVNAALLLTYVAIAKGDRVGLMTFSDTVNHYLSPQQGRGQFYRMLELLYAVQPQPVEPNYAHAMMYLAAKQRRRALMIIFTDLSGGISAQTLVTQAALLARKNLPLVVTMSDPDIHAAAVQSPDSSLGVFQRAAAAQLLTERQIVLDTLRRHGVLTLDVPANQVSAEIINRYLALKARMML